MTETLMGDSEIGHKHGKMRTKTLNLSFSIFNYFNLLNHFNISSRQVSVE